MLSTYSKVTPRPSLTGVFLVFTQNVLQDIFDYKNLDFGSSHRGPAGLETLATRHQPQDFFVRANVGFFNQSSSER